MIVLSGELKVFCGYVENVVGFLFLFVYICLYWKRLELMFELREGIRESKIVETWREK